MLVAQTTRWKSKQDEEVSRSSTMIEGNTLYDHSITKPDLCVDLKTDLFFFACLAPSSCWCLSFSFSVQCPSFEIFSRETKFNQMIYLCFQSARPPSSCRKGEPTRINVTMLLSDGRTSRIFRLSRANSTLKQELEWNQVDCWSITCYAQPGSGWRNIATRHVALREQQHCDRSIKRSPNTDPITHWQMITKTWSPPEDRETASLRLTEEKLKQES
jgi:hypothetical protein